jgi:hypothetical protein
MQSGHFLHRRYVAATTLSEFGQEPLKAWRIMLKQHDVAHVQPGQSNVI